MKKNRILTMLVLAFASAAPAATVWYNGDFNNVDGSLSASHALGFLDVSAMAYDDFDLAAPVPVSSVFGYFLMNTATPASASYEIRTGVGAGTGGAVIASGSGLAFSLVDTGVTFDTLNYGTLGIYRVTIGGLSLPLAAGTYWVGLQLELDPSLDQVALLAQTSGQGAIGSPAGNNGNSFLDSASLGLAFDPQSVDYALGLADASAAAIPEPASWALAALGGAVVLFMRRRR